MCDYKKSTQNRDKNKVCVVNYTNHGMEYCNWMQMPPWQLSVDANNTGWHLWKCQAEYDKKTGRFLLTILLILLKNS